MLILASNSPRRHALMQLITTDFTVISKDVDESLPGNPHPEEMVRTLSFKKAKAVSDEHPDAIVIGADTVVALFNEGGESWEVLGKPKNEQDAARMLQMLSGRRHAVYTGVTVIQKERCESFVEHASVEFIELSPKQIDAYIKTGEPMDKAGGYGIQEKGALLIRGIVGDFYTVMGFPVCRLLQLLEGSFGFVA